MIIHNTIHTRHYNAQAHQLGFPDFLEALRVLYAQHQSTIKAGQLLGMGNGTAWHWLKRLGVPVRTWGGCRTCNRLVITYQGREWTVAELARALHISPEYVRRKLYRGKLPGATYEKRIIAY